MIKKKLDMSAFLLAGIAVILAIGVIFVLYAMRRDSIETDLSEDRVLNSLFVFEHDNKPIGSFVVFYYSENNKVALVEVPGEVGLILSQVNRVDRIDTVYDRHRITPYVNEVERLLDVRIGYTIVFDMPNLGKFIDLLEGVSIFIPDSVQIYDGENSILFPSGITNLDGEKAEVYLTFEDSEEYGSEKRYQRVERFFLGLVKRVGEKREYLQIPLINKMFLSFVRTNTNDKTMSHLFSELSTIDTDRLSVITIGGNLREVSGKTLLIPYYDGSLIKEIVKQSLASLTRRAGSSGQVWTVEVLNGTNVVGLAGRTAELIRGFGYDVIKTGNADRNDYARSEVINRTKAVDDAKKFAEIIKCGNIINEALDESYTGGTGSAADYELKADFTLIIGRDFNGRYTNGG
ncbi:LytR family transcriptional regulator [Spirochaetia bacterium]|nr:LytR family transcriptional regulator [Spirochaetia bacterium]